MTKFIIVKQIYFCYGHRLMNYKGKCARLHGHNGTVEVELTANSLDEYGMVVDFGVVQKITKEFIDTHFDHRTLLRKDDPLIKPLQELGENPYLMDKNPTAENIAKIIFDYLTTQELPISSVRLWEGPHSCAEYKNC